MLANPHPIPDSYWVAPQRLLAGEYPGAKQDTAALVKLQQLVDAGVTLFLDLTEAGEYNLRPYAPLLPQLVTTAGVAPRHVRLSIEDLGTPTPLLMRTILDTIERANAAGDCVYVHCFGGIGRTGTVVGCYLIDHGFDPAAVIDEIAHRRRNTPDGHRPSPETAAQRRFVRAWPAPGAAGPNS